MLENSTKSDDDLCKIAVAPYAGAWIETKSRLNIAPVSVSLPTRERGLKLHDSTPYRSAAMSLPTRERGLKLWIKQDKVQANGRSLRGSVD